MDLASLFGVLNPLYCIPAAFLDYIMPCLSTVCVNLQVDQAALTGESLPVKKYSNDVCFSGSTIKQGEKHAIVYATGANTFFGRAAALIGATNNVANLQKIMTKIGGTCLVTIGVWMVIELAVQFGHYRHACAGGESKPSVASLVPDTCECSSLTELRFA